MQRLVRLPSAVRIVEVGPRDGLQNEPNQIPTSVKLQLINKLIQAGITNIEVGAFVSPKWVPQMKDTPTLLTQLQQLQHVTYSVLTPNIQGLQAALAVNQQTPVVHQVAVFTAASDAFTRKNINCTIAESFQRFLPVVQSAKEHKLNVRGYVSCVLGCPYSGDVDPVQVGQVAKDLWDMGCSEISLGDTIGVGTPLKTQRMLDAVFSAGVPLEVVAVHFHDTYGQALGNLLSSLYMGVSIVDSAVSGLGGCPYAAGASGNVGTEDVVYMLEGMGIETGVNLDKLLEVSDYVGSEILGPSNRHTPSKTAVALLNKKKKH